MRKACLYVSSKSYIPKFYRRYETNVRTETYLQQQNYALCKNDFICWKSIFHQTPVLPTSASTAI